MDTFKESVLDLFHMEVSAGIPTDGFCARALKRRGP